MKTNRKASPSNVSDYLKIMQHVYDDACMKCTADVSDLRDMKTIMSRTQREGVSFLTLLLPRFCKDFEEALALGQILPSHFENFKKCGAHPAFLQGMLEKLFDVETGRRYDDKNYPYDSRDIPTLVDSVRQICLVFKKMEIPCTPERDARACESFIATEQSFEMFTLPREDVDEFSLVSSVLWDGMLRDLHVDMLVPRHGPGATAERISGNQKYVWRYWHERLEPYHPLYSMGYSLSTLIEHDDDDLNQVVKEITFVSEEQEQPVRVCLVPKTLKGPRIIAIEPACMQYMQGGIRDILYDVIESYWLTSGHINFRDQSINQSLAISASKRGQFATIDLSDASDRVPRDLALSMFDSNPDLRDAIDACRSKRAEMPDGTIVGPLGKFASMGSALCFPVEAMYFYTLCVMAILKVRELPVSRETIFNVSRGVFVYGDDIIVPTKYSRAVLDNLQKYHCKVNSAKTFVTGKFRESCGTDAYDGQVVTPIYIHHECPKNRRQAESISSWVASANSFYLKGYWRTASHMYLMCEKILGSLPYVPKDSSQLGRKSLLGYCSIDRWNAVLHRFELNWWAPAPVRYNDVLDDYPALQKCLINLTRKSGDKVERNYFSTSSESVDERHLIRSSRHGAVTLKRRWAPAAYCWH